MNYTGTFATPDQLESLKGAMNQPLIALNAGMPRDPLKLSHEYAIEQGLPEIKGYYGCDVRTGEFVST